MARGSNKYVGVDEGLSVVCVLSPGLIYTEKHVERLRKMACDYAIHDEFLCITDSPYPRWWAKLSLFEPGRFTGRVLYLDLDVTVVGDLNDVAWYPGSFNICRDFATLGVNSSVMSWDAGAVDHLYTDFKPLAMDMFRGDQDWIGERMRGREMNTYPKDWCVSYRGSVEPTGIVPDDARVVVYHGQPKPWDIK